MHVFAVVFLVLSTLELSGLLAAAVLARQGRGLINKIREEKLFCKFPAGSAGEQDPTA